MAFSPYISCVSTSCNFIVSSLDLNPRLQTGRGFSRFVHRLILKMDVPRGGNAHFKESVYELHKRESHGFSPSVSHRLDHEVSLQGAGRRVAGADTNDYPAGVQRTGRPVVSGVLSREHVHMFVEIPPHIAVSDFVRRVKGRSSHWVQMEFPDLRKRYWGRHFWARGYFSTTSGNITDDVILQYLQEHEPTGVSR